MLGFIGTAMLMLAAHSSKRQGRLSGLGGTSTQHLERARDLIRESREGDDVESEFFFAAQATENADWVKKDPEATRQQTYEALILAVNAGNLVNDAGRRLSKGTSRGGMSGLGTARCRKVGNRRICRNKDGRIKSNTPWAG
jgi:hypothetical protein